LAIHAVRIDERQRSAGDALKIWVFALASLALPITTAYRRGVRLTALAPGNAYVAERTYTIRILAVESPEALRESTMSLEI
jgi:hypothetical protein